MGSIRIYKGMPPLTEEEIAELDRNKPKSDDEIDYSDIPRMTRKNYRNSSLRGSADKNKILQAEQKPFGKCRRAFAFYQFFDLSQNDGLISASTVKISRRLKNMNQHAQNLLRLGNKL